MRLYLDTNMILGWFKRLMQKERKDREFEIPGVMKFLSSQQNIELVVSNLTRIEVFRYLKSEWDADDNLSKGIWDTFLRSFNVKYIEPDIGSDDLDSLSELCLGTYTKKKTLTNLLHLQIAKRYNIRFLTGEKELKERYSFFYDKIVTYRELRQKLP